MRARGPQVAADGPADGGAGDQQVDLDGQGGPRRRGFDDGHRQIAGDDGALAGLAGDLEGSAHGFDEAPADRQAHVGAGLALADGLGDAVAGVVHRNSQLAVAPGGDLQHHSAGVGGADGRADQDGDHLSQANGVAVDQPGGGGIDVGSQVQALGAGAGPEQGADILGDLGGVDAGGLELGRRRLADGGLQYGF